MYSSFYPVLSPVLLTMDSWTLLKLIFVSFVLYVIGLYVYRMYFDPLSNIPGPKLAAASLWYEFYYDVIKKGRYTWKIWEMHDKYGKPLTVNALTMESKGQSLMPAQAPSSESIPTRYISMIPT